MVDGCDHRCGDDQCNTGDQAYAVAVGDGSGVLDAGMRILDLQGGDGVTKREKVIKGLEICSAGEWNSTGGRNHTDCPYYPAGYTGCTCKPLMRDALALLKAQEARVMTLEEVRALPTASPVAVVIEERVPIYSWDKGSVCKWVGSLFVQEEYLDDNVYVNASTYGKI